MNFFKILSLIILIALKSLSKEVFCNKEEIMKKSDILKKKLPSDISDIILNYIEEIHYENKIEDMIKKFSVVENSTISEGLKSVENSFDMS